jgi:phosphoglycerate dehydrogenase-like enzyme
MMMLNLARQTPRLIKNNYPLDYDRDFIEYRGIQLKGKTAGIIGLGNIGSSIAESCKGLGMNVIYWSRSSTNSSYKKVALSELVATADVIFPATAKTPETLALISDAHIDSMKKSAILVDIAHGLFNRAKIIDMIAKGHLFGYGFEGAPHEFTKLEGNIWAAPAYGWATYESMHNSMTRWVDNMVSAARNEFPMRVNNPTKSG